MIDVLTSFTEDWDSDSRAAELLEARLDDIRNYVNGGDFRTRFGDRDARVIIGTSYNLTEDAEAIISRFTGASGIPIETRMTAFRPPRIRATSVVLYEQGIALHRNGDAAGAITRITEALAIARNDSDVYMQSVALNSLAIIHRAAGHLDEADRLLREALPLRRLCGDRRGEAVTENNLGLVSMDLGRIDEARDHFETSLQLRESVGDSAGALKTLTNLSALETRGGVGRDQEVAMWYRRVAAAARAGGEPDTELKASCRLAAILGPLGLNEEARVVLDRAENLAIDAEDRMQHAVVLMARAGVLYQLNEPNKALHDAQLAVGLARDLGARRLIGTALNTLGVQYGAAGLSADALGSHEEALSLARETGNTRGAVVAGVNAALELRKTREYDRERALEFTRDAMEAARQASDDDGAAYGSWAHALICGDSDRTEDARAAYEDAVGSVESWRKGIGGDEFQSSAFGSVGYYYDDFLGFLVHTGDTARAFEVADSAKSRRFVDQLGSGPLPVPAGLDPEDPRLVREGTLRSEANRIDRALQSGDDPGTGATYARQGALRRELDTVWTNLAKDAPDYVALRRGTPTRLGEILDALGEHAGLVEMYVLKDEVVALVVRPGDERPALARTGVSAASLPQRIASFRREVADYRLGHDVAEKWQSLGRALIEPIMPYLGNLDLVYFSPHRELHSLPLHAVRVSDSPLAEQIAVAYTPSASVLHLVDERDRARPLRHADTALVMAYTANDHERDDFEGEGREVAERLGTQAHVGTGASAQLLRDAGADADVIHLSCHGRFEPADPLSSCVILSDGPLTARDIIGLKLNARLVTISACRTGESDVAAGDELMGLTRAFLYAGASAVIVTMWEVDAKSARELMVDFYRRRAETRQLNSPAKLLQGAMRTLRETRGHPFYWAPFVVVGNAGSIE